jgi:hypothetical protein
MRRWLLTVFASSGSILLVGAFAFAFACGGGTPAPQPASAPAPASDDPMRALTRAECQSLGEWMAEACRTKPNERSERIEGWCSEIVRGVGDGSWVSGVCVKNVRYMDSVCFRSTTNVHSMRDCDSSVHRP